MLGFAPLSQGPIAAPGSVVVTATSGAFSISGSGAVSAAGSAIVLSQYSIAGIATVAPFASASAPGQTTIEAAGSTNLFGAGVLSAGLSSAGTSTLAAGGVPIHARTLGVTAEADTAIIGKSFAHAFLNLFGRGRFDIQPRYHKIVAFSIDGVSTLTARAAFQLPAGFGIAGSSAAQFQSPRPAYEFDCTLPAQGARFAIKGRATARFQQPESSHRAVHIHGRSRFSPQRLTGRCTIFTARAASRGDFHARAVALAVLSTDARAVTTLYSLQVRPASAALEGFASIAPVASRVLPAKFTVKGSAAWQSS